MFNSTGKKFILLFALVLLLFFISGKCLALPTGTILYKTSENGKMFGYGGETRFSMIPGEIYPGGVGIYLGEMNGKLIVVEADKSGVRIIPAKYFVDLDKGENFVGAKIPIEFNYEDKDFLNKFLNNISYQVEGKEFFDYTYQHQKGPSSGQWTSVGFVEKMFESAGRANLSYHAKPDRTYDVSSFYSIDITPDGYDQETVVNEHGDVVSESKEFSKIHKLGGGDFWEKIAVKEVKDFAKVLGKAGEITKQIIDTNIFGRDYKEERYFFFPYTQFIQPSLRSVQLDINVSSYGKSELPSNISEAKIKENTVKALAERLTLGVGLKITKNIVLEFFHLKKAIVFYDIFKENVNLIGEGIQLATNGKVDIDAEKIQEIVLAQGNIQGAISTIEETIEYAEAKMKENTEKAERLSLIKKKQEALVKRAKEIVDNIEITTKEISDNAPKKQHFGEVQEVVEKIVEKRVETKEIAKSEEKVIEKVEESKYIRIKQRY